MYTQQKQACKPTNGFDPKPSMHMRVCADQTDLDSLDCVDLSLSSICHNATGAEGMRGMVHVGLPSFQKLQQSGL